ncbi:hypothetical protein ACIBSV_14790 [Embleya sp. NPDC050154]|uniref:hypothetical protein n=1 Tax=Embleya sp. NPDC050154 TaxID=3363988 RepID=UPI00379F5F02
MLKTVTAVTRGLQKMGADARTAGTALGGMRGNATAAQGGISQVGKSVAQAERELGRIQKTANSTRTAMGNIQNGGKSASSGLTAVRNPANQSVTAFGKMKSAGDRLGTSIKNLRAAGTQGAAGVTQARNQANQTNPVFTKAKATTDRLGTSIQNLRTAGTQAGSGISQAKNQAGQADTAFGKAKKGSDGFKGELNNLEKQSNETKKALGKVGSEADGVEKSVGKAGKGAGAGKQLFSELSGGLGMAEGAQKGLNGAMKASAFGLIIALVVPLIEHFGGLGAVADRCKTAVVKAWEGIRDGIRPVIEGLMSILRGPVNAWLSGINWVIRGVNKIHFSIPNWVPGIGGKEFGINLPELPMMAKGGIVRPRSGGTAAILGEAGEAEAVIPLSKLDKYLGTGANAGGGFHIENYFESNSGSARQTAEQLMFLAKARG